MPGGLVRLGETIRQATQRETCEECGVEIESGGVIDVRDNIVFDGTGRIRFHFVVIYLLARYMGGEAQPASDALDIFWVAREELEALDMHPLARKAIRRSFEVVREGG